MLVCPIDCEFRHGEAHPADDDAVPETDAVKNRLCADIYVKTAV
ncbi:hypothetical protein A2U01_0055402 [Trifolium medium]|uniref:Uncharacterized protein n=1 Tax=Trifolium medium TaxID=97028 RepID=A0A392RDS8_9FABA|nr:hypothetical protein [Trifolium medium]